MLIVLLNDKGQATAAVDNFEQVRSHVDRVGPKFKTYAEADKLVKELNAIPEGDRFTVAYETRAPRGGDSVPYNITIIRQPSIGDNVFSTLNGKDRRSAGQITALRQGGEIVITSSGGKYVRRNNSGVWHWKGRHLAH